MGYLVSKDDGWRCRTGCGSVSSRCCHHRRFTRWGVTRRGARSRCDGRDPAGAQDGDAVERVERDRGVLELVGASALSGVGAGGVFAEIWRQGLLDYDGVVGIDWTWLAATGR